MHLKNTFRELNRATRNLSYKTFDLYDNPDHGITDPVLQRQLKKAEEHLALAAEHFQTAWENRHTP